MSRDIVELKIQPHVSGLLLGVGCLCLFLAFAGLNHFITTTRHIFSLVLSFMYFYFCASLFNIAFMKWKIETDAIEIRSIFYYKLIQIKTIKSFKVSNLQPNILLFCNENQKINLSYAFFDKASAIKGILFLEAVLETKFEGKYIDFFLGRLKS